MQAVNYLQEKHEKFWVPVPVFSVKIQPSSGVRSGYAETPTGTAVSVPQKPRGEGNFPASFTAVCVLCPAEGHGAEASKPASE